MSSSPSDHARWRAELAAYSLGALDPGEGSAVEQHLADCEHCRADLQWLQPALETLPESVEQLKPPPELRERLMTVVRADAAEATAGRLAVDETERALKPAGRRRGARGFLLRPVGVAVIGAVVIAGIIGYGLHGGGGDQTSTIAALRAFGAGDANAFLIRKGDSGTLRVTSMPPLKTSEVYEAWVRNDGRVERASLFLPGKDGSAAAAIPQGLDGAQEVIVTREPKGGATQPGRVLLRAPLK
jgi:anti-sigma factor RsiW